MRSLGEPTNIGERGRAVKRLGVIALAAAVTACASVQARTLRLAYQSDVATLDPQAIRETFTTQFLSNVMEPLVRYGGDLQLEPALAESWERLAPTRWRFHLRRGVRFSNGNAFTAEDVLFTYRRGSAPTSPLRGNISGVAGMRKIDDYTLDVDTSGPYPLVLRELTSMLIFDGEWVEEVGEGALARRILGTGPFVVTSYSPGGECVLRANDDWWDASQKQHNLTEVRFQPLRSAATRVAALISGQVDLILSVPLQDIERIGRAPSLRILEQPSLRTLMLGMNVSGERLRNGEVNPLRDIRVREALYRAVDIDAIVTNLMRGRAEPAGAIIAPGVNGYDSRLRGRIPFDLEEARRLMADAGFGDGFQMNLECPNDRYVNDEAICTSLAGMFAKIDVRVDLRTRTKARYFQEILGEDPDMFLLGWASADTLDAQSFLKDILHTPGGSMGSFNIGGYSNPRVDALEPRAAEEPDPAKRRDLLTLAFQIHKDDIAHIPLHTQHVVWAARENIEVLQAPLDAVWLRFFRVR